MTSRSSTRRQFLRTAAVVSLLPGMPRLARAAADPSRLALVIGNDAYPNAKLSNAGNDATSMAAMLTDAGFETDLRIDAGRTDMVDATRRFAAAAARSDVRFVFFYYAGHGTQLDWRNYLLPVDAKVNTAADLPAQCLDLVSLLGELARAKGKTFVIVLDACRDNPFGAAIGTAQKGLSQFDAPPGSLLAFSTAPGSVAADGDGRSARYTEHLVRELSVRGARLEDAFKRVRLAVRVASRGTQVPWESTSLESDVVLFPVAKKLSETELEAEFQRELATWNRIKGSKDSSDWIAYLREHPSGRFTEIAQSRLAYFVARDEAARVPQMVVALATSSPAAAPAPVVSATAIATAPAVRVESAAIPQPADEIPAVPAQVAVASPPALPGGAPVVRSVQLEIVPGRAAPVLMRPSANPMSAGTYSVARTPSVGDEVTYTRRDPDFRGPTSEYTLRITAVDLEADRVEFNDGALTQDAIGNVFRFDGNSYDPPLQMIPVQLQLGRKWTSRFRVTQPTGTAESYYDFHVAARERLKMPFGEMEAFRVNGEGFNMRYGVRLSLAYWLVPGVNFTIRTEQKRYDGRSLALIFSEVRELVACRQQHWIQA